MKRENILEKTFLNAYKYYTVCFICEKKIPVYFTICNDFGEQIALKKCRICDTFYGYDYYEYYLSDLDDDTEIQKIEKRLENKKCIKCHENLNVSLVSTTTNIKCCGNSFSLDNDFNLSRNSDTGVMEQIEVYMNY